jgi:hypothetical protein
MEEGRGQCGLLFVSKLSNYQNGDVSNQLTDIGRWGWSVLGGDSDYEDVW